METCPKIEMISFDSKLCNYDSTEIGEKILHVSYVLYLYLVLVPFILTNFILVYLC